MAGFAMVSGLALLWPAGPAGAVTFPNACINSAVPTDFSQVDVDLTGTVPASVEPGASFQLTNISQTLALPGAIFVAGYNLGLLVEGQNTVPGTIRTVIEGTNTTEGIQNTSTESVSWTFTITDPDGTPGTGDETATDASTTVTYDDQTWTAGPAGTIEFREDTVTPQSATVGGIVTTATIGGILTVRFGCNPGTVLAGPPETISLVDPAASFATTQSESSSSTTTTTLPGGTTTTTTLPPVTLDVGIDATKLVIVDKLTAADKAKTVFVAKTPDAAKGPGTDPDMIGAVLDVSYVGASATAGQFVVPAGALSGDAGWKANKDTVAKFVNKAAPGGPTGAKVAVIKPTKLLKLVGKSLGDTPIAITTAGAPDAGGVDVVYTVLNGESTVRHCTRFAQDACVYKSIAADSGSKLVCKNGTAVACPAIAACDVFAQDCPSGQGCYATGSVPEAECSAAGAGTQGATCSSQTDCAAGFACACSTSCQCLEICDTSSPTCPALTPFCTSLIGTGIPDLGVCL